MEDEIKFLNWDETIERLLTRYFQYGRQPLHPVLLIISENIQIVWEIYRNHPETCINLLRQIAMPFTKEEYEKKILAPIKKHAQKNKPLKPLPYSLIILRKMMGDDPQFISDTFHREINMIKKENKTKVYKEIVKELCEIMLNEAIEKITAYQSTLPDKKSEKIKIT